MQKPPTNLNQEIVRLYIDEKMNIRDIAERFGYSYSKIYGILRKRVALRKATGPGRPRTKESFRSKESPRIAESIRRRILDGQWKPGDKIPPRLTLADEYGVSQNTVDDAIADLRERGYLLAIRSKGTFVRPKEDWGMGEGR